MTAPADDLLAHARFDERGLLPVVAQDAHTGQVLMLAFADAEALRLTLATGAAHFFSRSRGALWKKGETSGHTLAVVEVRLDCDGDAALYRVVPAGPACHTNRPSCFFRAVEGGTLPSPLVEDDGPAGQVLDVLGATVAERRRLLPAGSYVADLLRGGAPAIAAKIAEEQAELVAELAAPDAREPAIVHEAADLFFHVLVGLGARGVAPAAVLRELGRRLGTSGHEEKRSRAPKKE